MTIADSTVPTAQDTVPPYDGPWQPRFGYQIADTFVGGSEGEFGAMSNTDFVACLYLSGLMRSGSDAEVSYWAGQIDDGVLGRGDVLLGIADSAEMTAHSQWMSTSFDFMNANLPACPTGF